MSSDLPLFQTVSSRQQRRENALTHNLARAPQVTPPVRRVESEQRRLRRLAQLARIPTAPSTHPHESKRQRARRLAGDTP